MCSSKRYMSFALTSAYVSDQQSYVQNQYACACPSTRLCEDHATAGLMHLPILQVGHLRKIGATRHAVCQAARTAHAKPTRRRPAQGLTKVHVNALVNDTVAALAAARYLDGPDAVGSVIMGTGARLRGCTALARLLAVAARHTSAQVLHCKSHPACSAWRVSASGRLQKRSVTC